MIEALIFDKDGTLFDFQATWGVWAGQIIKDVAKGDPELVRRLVDILDYDLTTQTLLPQSLVIAGTPAEIVESVLPVLPDWTAKTLFDHLNTRAAQAPQVPVTDLNALFEKLRAKGLKLGVMTNDAEAPAKANLAPYLDRLDCVIGSDSGYGAKPAADPVESVARLMGVQSKACAMVGDSNHDLLAGRAAGMTTIAVLTGLATQQDLAPNADVVLPDVSVIPDWLEGQVSL